MKPVNSEFDIIRHYFNKPVSNTILGIGDDAALIGSSEKTVLAISADTLVVDRHFSADVDPYKLGYKSLAVNLSDMAAMGAKPRWTMLSLTLPVALAKDGERWLNGFSKGFFELAEQYQVELIGGDTTSGPLNIGVQIIGEVAECQALRRDGAILNDEIWISGRLGDAALALCHQQEQICLLPEEADQCLTALHQPIARVELGQRLIGLAHSAIDISDGLIADLGHILSASNKSAKIYLSDVPCSKVVSTRLDQMLAVNCLLAGGDDYELCFTVPCSKHQEIENLSNELSLSLTCIGEITDGDGLIVYDRAGKEITLEKKGYDHFGS